MKTYTVTLTRPWIRQHPQTSLITKHEAGAVVTDVIQSEIDALTRYGRTVDAVENRDVQTSADVRPTVEKSGK